MASSFWDDIKEKASWAAEQIGERLEEATEAGKTEFEALKLRRQIDTIEDEVNDLFRQLGRRAFELYEAEDLEDAECKGIGAEIQAKKDKATEIQEEIEKLREQFEENRKTREEEAARKAEVAAEKKQDEEEGIDGEAVWEDDDGDDGTPPPP